MPAPIVTDPAAALAPAIAFVTCALCGEPVAECEAISLGGCAGCLELGHAVEAHIRGDLVDINATAQHDGAAWACDACVLGQAEREEAERAYLP